MVLTSLLLLLSGSLYAEEPSKPGNDSIEVMQVFNDNALENAKIYDVADEKKHKILFFMGVGLLILLCTTAYLGVSMVMFNKEVFVAHMISAGFTVTLGLVHAVTAVVWFFPF
jgi:hypothetical protein